MNEQRVGKAADGMLGVIRITVEAHVLFRETWPKGSKQMAKRRDLRTDPRGTPEVMAEG